MTLASLSRSLLGDAVVSTASSLVSPGEHLSWTSPPRTPVTPRRGYRPVGDYDNTPRAGFGDEEGAVINGHRMDQRTRQDTPGGEKPSKLTILASAPNRIRKTSRPPPLRTSSPDITSSDTSSPTEHDGFLPRSAQLITPSLLPQHQNDGKLGTFTAVNIILGKTIGVGVYSVPSSIFSDVGSVGMTIALWILGAFISFCGLAVYLDLGSALPRSGGERVYLERIFRRPRMLATCMFMAYVVLLGFSAPNCIVMGEYIIYALGLEPSTWLIRALATITITVACVMHARFPTLGIFAINVLGVAKMAILAFVVFSGIAASVLSIGPSSTANPTEPLTIAQRNFSNIWVGSSSSPYAYSTALLKILYCFRGYNSANTVLSSVRRPVPTLKVAAPLALGIVAASYLLANIAYFCAVEKEDFRAAGVILAGRFLGNLFGEQIGTRVLPWLVIISAFGNVAATSYAQARVNQELGRDGLLPYSDFWAGNSGFSTCAKQRTGPSVAFKDSASDVPSHVTKSLPISNIQGIPSIAPALFLHFLVSALVILLPPPGQIYTFLLEIGGYPVSILSVTVAAGLLYLQLNPNEQWQSPLPARRIWVVIFLVANLGVCILPWIKPRSEETSAKAAENGQEQLFPYYAYPATGLGILAIGVYYWVWWTYLRPRIWPAEHEPMDSRDAGEDMIALTNYHHHRDHHTQRDAPVIERGVTQPENADHNPFTPDQNNDDAVLFSPSMF